MIKVLFLIHDLGPGGAEKVLVNLVNNLDETKFDITVMSLFDIGINKQFLKPHVKYCFCFKHMIRGNIHLMKFLSPAKIHKWLIKDRYDIEISYLEGPSARIISGCQDQKTKLVSWIHIEQHKYAYSARSFRSIRESIRCYGQFHRTICVSECVKNDFLKLYPNIKNIQVLYNTNETEKIHFLAQEPIEDDFFNDDEFYICGIGKLDSNKGFDRLLHIQKMLVDHGYPIHVILLGSGKERKNLEEYSLQNGLKNKISFLGYQTNPYKYLVRSNLFVCASLAEGFSTATSESLIVGTPVCTVDVSGMKEMLGENNEYGVITQNNETALFRGIKQFLDNPEYLEHYKMQAYERGKWFSTQNTVKAVERMLEELFGGN